MKNNYSTHVWLTKSARGIALICALMLFVSSANITRAFTPDNANKIDPMQASKAMRGNFKVGEFTGAAMYNYPIALPAGRKGMTPSLSITHNSQLNQFENIMGWNWDITMYEITRINKTGIEKMYTENNFSATTPLDSGELFAKGNGFYGLRSDSAMSRYEFKGDNTWLVTGKNGTKYIFGATDDTRQFDPEDATRTKRWMLSEIRDTNGNWIKYSYLKDGNQIYPKEINYSGNGTEAGIFKVRFLPFADSGLGDQRTDRYFSYKAGFRVETDYLVNGIEVLVNGKLRRKYDILHTNVSNLAKQTVSRIVETAYDENGNATSLPSTTFDYTISDVRWAKTDKYTPDFLLKICGKGTCNKYDNILQWDMTGDGIDDFEYFKNGSDKKMRAVSDVSGGWNYEEPKYIVGRDTDGTQIPNAYKKPIDFDGDGRIDLVKSGWTRQSFRNRVYSQISLFRGNMYNDTIPVAMGSPEVFKSDNGVSIADLNADGLPDLIQGRKGAYSSSFEPFAKSTCLNGGGTSCEKTDLWPVPKPIITDRQWDQNPRQLYVQDCNYDGLADAYFSGSGRPIWINDGKGGFIDGSTIDTPFCKFIGQESQNYRQADVNGDGLIDAIKAYRTTTSWGWFDTKIVDLNDGTNTLEIDRRFPITFGSSGSSSLSDAGIRLVDINGDKLPDIIKSSMGWSGSNSQGKYVTKKEVWLNTSQRPYFLKTIRTSEGARIDLQYKTSAQYLKDDGSKANPNLPFIIDTVSKVSVNPGTGSTMSTKYFYEDGFYHFQNSYNREFTGFRVVKKTDEAGIVTKTYYHQSQFSMADSANGEYNDNVTKKGRPYREEVYDAEGNLMAVTINKWEHEGNGSSFGRVYLTQTITINKVGTEKATAKAFDYDAYGNQILIVDYGEVQAANDGTFTDIGNDLIKIERTFENNNVDYLVEYPSQEQIFDQSGTKISEQKFYYDDLPSGQVIKGNKTKTEQWLNDGDRYITSTTSYNALGLPVSVTNPRGGTTLYTYDNNNLYPITTQNALGQKVQTLYDPATGALLMQTDANGAMVRTTYDGLGRPIKIESSDPNNISQLVTRQTVAYIDIGTPRQVKKTVYGDNAVAVVSIQYLDGIGRTVQTKQQASGSDWITSTNFYNNRGNLQKTTLPYFSATSAYEPSVNQVGKVYLYDALNRPISEISPIGTTTIEYNGWSKLVTDPQGTQKTLNSDARGRLTQVIEHINSGQTTNYSYDAQGNLIGMVDSAGNLRELTYDSLGRKTSQTAPHKPNTGFGFWRYNYDDNGNLISQTDPKNQTTNYTYDALDRALTENNLTFTYDQGQNSIGRLSRIDGTDYSHDFTYDGLGRTTVDHKRIGPKNFTSRFAYDLMGGITRMTYPDDTVVEYAFDNAHNLSQVTVNGVLMAGQFKYSPTGQLTQMQLGNGVVTTNTYDPNQMYRMTNRKTLNKGVLKLQDYRYDYDAVGNLLTLTDNSNGMTAKTINYEYDPLYRLTEARYTATANSDFIVQNYQYDVIGNMTFKSDVGDYTYDSTNPHAVIQAGDKAYSYDENGNMTNSNGIEQTFDYRNRLISSDGLASYAYGEGYERLTKTDLKTGKIKYYPNKYYEIDSDKEVKYIYAGNQRIAKLTRLLIEAPTIDPFNNPVQRPSVTLTGTKPKDLALWVNGQELLPIGPETVWSYTSDLIIGNNEFDFYSVRADGERSRSIKKVIAYDVPIPTVEFIDSPVYRTRQTLTGTKRPYTNIAINGEDLAQYDELDTWTADVELTQELNTFLITAKDEVGNESDSARLDLTYEVLSPTVEAFSEAKNNPFKISGTKGAELSIWANDKEIVPINDSGVWEANLTLNKGVNAFHVFSKNKYGTASTGINLSIPYNTNAPSVDPVDSPTTATTIVLSGTKRAGTSVWVDDEEIIPLNSETDWGAVVELKSANNVFNIYTKDAAGIKSDSNAVTVDYQAKKVILDPVIEKTTDRPYRLSGRKVPGTGVVINGKMVIQPDDTDVWIYELPLEIGDNFVEILTRSKFGIKSDPITFNIYYKHIPNKKKTAYSAPSGGGGKGRGNGNASYKNPFELRKAEKAKQEAEIKEEIEAENAPLPVVDITNKKALAKIKIRKQSAPRPSIPKNLRPQVANKTGAEFKNLQVVYKGGKAIISWDSMSREAAKFEIFRSKRGYPHKLSKHASQKIAEISPKTPKNRFVDTPPKRREKYTYRIVALNHQGKILTTSIQLHVKQIFIGQGETATVDFKKLTNEKFDKVYIAKNDNLTVKRTKKGNILKITPKDGFSQGTKIYARFLTCQKSKAKKDFCKKSGGEIYDVFVIRKNHKVKRFSSIFRSIADLIVPTANAASDPFEGQKVYYFLNDHLGSVDVVLDADGNVVERRDYLPYGATRSHIKDADESQRQRRASQQNAYRFTGQELDSETGLYYYGARYYDPELGRFISADPWEGDLTNPQTLNKYSYAVNNPVFYVDPTGMYVMETGEVEKGDTFSGVAKELNKYYGTSYNVADYAKFNNISGGIKTGDKVRIGTLDGWQPPQDANLVTESYWNELTTFKQKLLHYSRNFYQKNSNMPKNLTEAMNSGKFILEGMTATHNLAGDIGNLDFRGTGKLEGYQAIYDILSEELITSNANVGTYDFVSPNEDKFKHYKLDVSPWIKWGNNAKDTTTSRERYGALKQTIKDYLFQ